MHLLIAALGYLAPLRQAVPPRAARPVARATGVMQQMRGLGLGATSKSKVPVSISVTGFNSRCISVRRDPLLGAVRLMRTPRASSC